MRITVEIEDQRIREDEPRAYEDAVNAFAAEWKRRLALREPLDMTTLTTAPGGVQLP